jgi:Mn-dependent DtxR family transcriptional regulator
MKTHESAENYLETILVLSREDKKVRSIDIVNKLGFSKPSVSIAMKKLRESDYIVIDGDGYITFTESGRKIADSMYERHMLLSEWLISLGVDKETAIDDACKIEHCLSEQSFSAIKNLYKLHN